MNQHRFVEWRTASGEPTTIQGVTVTPQSRSLQLTIPWGGFAWNHPVAVVVRRGDDEQRIPLVDVTRIVQLSIYGAAFLLTMLFWLRRE